MKRLRDLRFWGPSVRQDVDDELRFHVDARVAEYVAAGMSPEAARAEALRRFGRVEPIRTELYAMGEMTARERRRADSWDALRQDLRFTTRSLRKGPAFTAAAVLTLALGIGANTAIFSVVNGILLRPLPYPEPERMVEVRAAFPGLGFPEGGSVSEPEYFDLRAAPVLESVAAYSTRSVDLTGVGDPERVRVAAATASLFRVLATPPAVGRAFTDEEDFPGRDAVAVLAHGFWRRRFAADPGVLGRALTIGGVRRTVVGVMPPGEAFAGADVYLPLALRPDSLNSRGAHYLTALGRLRRGGTLEAAQQALGALGQRLVREYPQNYPATMGFGILVRSLHEVTVGHVRPALLTLLAAVGLVLLVACVNVANLLLARAEQRQQEVAVRMALGAGRGRLVRQMLTESAVLAALGGAAGIALAAWGVDALVALSPPGALPRAGEVAVDGAAAAAAVALTLLTGLAFGLVPALQASRLDAGAALREAAAARGSTGGRRRQRIRRALVMGEVAAAVVLVSGAALLLRSFRELRRTDPGFDAEGVLLLHVSPPAARYADGAPVAQFYDRLVARLAALPGVEGAAAAANVPLGGGAGNWDVELEGRPRVPGVADPSPDYQVVTADYFRVMRIPIVRGRSFAASDGERAPLAGVVNETMARTLWPGRDALGRRFRVRGDSTTPWMTVVGIARDVRRRSLAEPPRAEYYMLEAQLPAMIDDAFRSMSVMVRAATAPGDRARATDRAAQLADAVRREVRALDPELAVANVQTMRAVVEESVARQRFTTLVLSAFGAAALLLAAVGVYGVMAYAVARREREMGIRMALGARAADVVRLVVGQALRLTLAGVALGVAAALAGARLIESLLYGVRPTDPLTFLLVPLALTLVALLASWFPARRATRVDPASVMRGE